MRNFSFFGPRSFFAPYVAGAFFSDLPGAQAQQQANLLLAGFGTLLYCSVIVGGWVADNVLGEVRAVRVSQWLAVLGLLGMAWPGRLGFMAALAFFAVAFGISISFLILIGRNYAGNDPRRDAGYTLFYLVACLGSFVAPFICSVWIGNRWGYRWGFVAAAAAMAMAVVIFEWSHRRLPDAGARPRYGGKFSTPVVVLGVIVLTCPGVWLLMHPEAMHAMVYSFAGILLLYFLLTGFHRRDPVQGRHYLALLLLFIALVAFWSLSLQSMTSLNFFARDYVNAPFDFTLFQSANPLFVLVLAPLFVLLWPWLEKRGIALVTPRKFAAGLFLIALGYGVLLLGIHYAQGGQGKIPWWLLVVYYGFATLGELVLMPISYAVVARLAAPGEASLVMGAWVFGSALAYDVSGRIAAQTTAVPGAGIAGYTGVYEILFWVGLGFALMLFALSPWIHRLMRAVR